MACISGFAILNRHRAQLRFGMHPDQGLQKDWNELGEEGFEFEILDTNKSSDQPGYDRGEDLRILEQPWMEKLSVCGGQGYSTKPRRAGS